MNVLTVFAKSQIAKIASDAQANQIQSKEINLDSQSNSFSTQNSQQSPAAILQISQDSISALARGNTGQAVSSVSSPFSSTTLPSTSHDSNIDALLLANYSDWWHISAPNQNTNPVNLIESNLYSLVPSGAANLNLTYNFLSSAPSDTPNPTTDDSGFSAFTSSEKAAVKAALNYISSITKLTFTEVSTNDTGNINFGNNNQGSVSNGYAYIPTPVSHTKTYLFLNNNGSLAADLNNVTPGSYDWLTIFHEIGHTLGLKHPGNYNAGGGGTPGPYLPSQLDNQQYSIMSYHPSPGGGYDRSYMLYDVAALQYLYGINKSSSTAVSGVFQFNSSSTQYEQTLWSTNGADLINLTGLNNANLVNLNAGTFSSINIWGASSFSQTGLSGTGINDLAIAYGSNINKVTLESGSLSDEVVLNGAYKQSQYDVINNLSSSDKIGISASIYGALNSTNIQFGTSSTSNSSAHKIIVNTSNNSVYYDPDGTGPVVAKKIAQYTKIGSFSISASNFSFVA